MVVGLSELFHVLKLLTPFDVTSHLKRRIGTNADGGYVLFDDFENVSVVYSFGIGGNVDFDEAFADIGKSVYMFDHTIEGPPRHHPNFCFYGRGLSSSDDAEQQTFSLAHYISELDHEDRNDMILKIDVEGAEWDVISKIDTETLGKFRQIVLELHSLLRLDQEDFRSRAATALQKLCDQFVLGHVHANNWGSVGFVHGLTVADVLELTYIRKDLVNFQNSTMPFPQSVDFSNDPSRPDIPLWFYPFLPGSSFVDEKEFLSSLQNCNRTEIQAQDVAGNTDIPRRIFQTWKVHSPLPKNFEAWSHTIRAKNPSYKYVLWDDEENRSFIKEHFEWFLEKYDSFDREIFRVDSVRYFALFYFGGFYMDLDVECFAPLDRYLNGCEVIFGRMGTDPNDANSIPNAIMAASPRQEFWLYCFSFLVEGPSSGRVESVTGPEFLKRCVDRWNEGFADNFDRVEKIREKLNPELALTKKTKTITLLPSKEWFPVDWTDPLHQIFRQEILGGKEFSQEEKAKFFNRSVLATYWTHSW